MEFDEIAETPERYEDDLEEFEVSLMPLAALVAALRRGEIAQLSSAAALGLAALALERRGASG